MKKNKLNLAIVGKKHPHDEGIPPVPAYWLATLQHLAINIEWLIRHLRDPNPLQTSVEVMRQRLETAKILDEFMERTRFEFEIRDKQENRSKK